MVAGTLTLVAGMGNAALGAWLDNIGLASGSLFRVACGFAVSAALGCAAGRAMSGRSSPQAVHRRGALIEAEAGAAERSEARLQQAVRRASLGAVRSRTGHRQALTLAGIEVAALDETKHFKLIGTTGTGKSTAICELLGAALERGDRAVIADPDGGYLERFANPRRGDVILNPFESRSLKWDLFGEIRTPYDIDQLARSLLPDQGGADRSWTGYARTFFGAVVRQAHTAGVRDIGELYRLLVVAGAPELRKLVEGTAAQPFLDEHNVRMFDSIRSVTSSAVGPLEYIAAQNTAPLSVRNWVQAGAQGGAPQGAVLFIPYRAGQIAALRSTISAWMRLAIFEAMSQPEGDQRLWFVVDELDALGQIDGLKDALARLRKFGGRCVLGFQSVAQVSSTYGLGEAQTLVENCGNTLILRCSSSDHGGTAAFASRLIGQREVLRTSISHSRRPMELLSSTTLSEHVGIEPAVMDSQIEQLPDLEGYLKFASAPSWRRIRLAPQSPAQVMSELCEARTGASARNARHKWRSEDVPRTDPDASTTRTRGRFDRSHDYE